MIKKKLYIFSNFGNYVWFWWVSDHFPSSSSFYSLYTQLYHKWIKLYWLFTSSPLIFTKFSQILGDIFRLLRALTELWSKDFYTLKTVARFLILMTNFMAFGTAIEMHRLNNLINFLRFRSLSRLRFFLDRDWSN